MSLLALRLRSRWQPREWPRYREGAERDYAEWVASLDDAALARLAAGITQVDRAVEGFHGRPPPPELSELTELVRDPKRSGPA